jgi:hypothetical protein
MKAWKGHSVGGPAEMGMTLLKGDERPAEIIILAYGMEEALRRFYASRADTASTIRMYRRLLAQLADIETNHKDSLFGLYEPLADNTPLTRMSFEADIVTDFLEGGFTTDALQSRKPVRVAIDGRCAQSGDDVGSAIHGSLPALYAICALILRAKRSSF